MPRIKEIQKENIIEEMRDSRKNFVAHMSQKTESIPKIERICDSNLGDLLDELEKIVVGYHIVGIR